MGGPFGLAARTAQGRSGAWGREQSVLRALTSVPALGCVLWISMSADSPVAYLCRCLRPVSVPVGAHELACVKSL